MKFETDSKKNITPIQDEIPKLIQELNKPDCEFVILSKSKYEFIQVSNSKIGEYQLEISEKENNLILYQSIKENFTLDEVTGIFIKYYRNDLSWKKNYKWKKIIEKNTGFVSKTVSNISMIIGGILIILYLINLKFFNNDKFSDIFGIKFYYYFTLIGILFSLDFKNDLKKINEASLYSIDVVYILGIWFGTIILTVISILALTGIIKL